MREPSTNLSRNFFAIQVNKLLAIIIITINIIITVNNNNNNNSNGAISN